MENLNAEQVISELRKNDSCYVEDIKAIRNAIALISSQEQRIKELDKDNQRLYYICQSYALQYGTVADKEVFLKKDRADTVRKMQERSHEQFHDRVAYTRSYVHDTIDQIAKEMLEDAE